MGIPRDESVYEVLQPSRNLPSNAYDSLAKPGNQTLESWTSGDLFFMGYHLYLLVLTLYTSIILKQKMIQESSNAVHQMS
jgi:hypothetical protein